MDSPAESFRERTRRKFEVIALNRAIRELHHRGVSSAEIAVLTGIPRDQVREHLTMSDTAIEADDVWMIVLARELGYHTTDAMMELLTKFTYYVFVPALDSADKPVGSGVVPAAAVQAGYLSRSEYKQLSEVMRVITTVSPRVA